ncbi:cellobiose phosphorylase [Bacillus sp. FJAT-27264]|uniref:cellobiose phosphorylase n=1 Tax=Paenibacillus sp. (strain DSM 101736 / FJAT-27264) TaxID=1850362 RepID=UPI000807A5D5|nr:cellobiose phosphorylase [Bacillus sp. FJAT-27264]OBZ10556.1 cellobiose phosphorylase [Bacillus sp. FJAT-27264]
MSHYYFDSGKFVIEQFHEGKPFASFLPGLAGLKGIPMWSFYVNRGQGVCSFGIRDKNSPIMEFSPANISYKNVANSGFRTFIKIKGEREIYEPFQSARPDADAKRVMTILPNGLTIEESHAGHGLKTTVHYFNLPNEDYAALVRRVTIENIGGQEIDFELLDGLPEILPFGVENSGYKDIGNLLRSWMDVYNLENGIPFYKLRSSTNDDAEVSEITKGHFYLSFTGEGEKISPFVDFEVVFGGNTSLSYPDRFAELSLSGLAELPQYPVNKVPCGFSGVARTLAPGSSLTVNTLIGHVNDIDKINNKATDISRDAYITDKAEEAARLTEDLTEDIATKTSSPIFDAYCRQSYLDNFLRGGYPFIFDNGGDGFVVHLYSRKHGDMERDYNFFSLAPEYYSQGNGNFRDMNQNRRNDVFFNPKVGSFNIKMFYSLMQADGYNPLSVQGTTFEILPENRSALEAWIEKGAANQHEGLRKLLSGVFTAGGLINHIADHHVELQVEEQEFLSGVLSLSKQNIEASFGEGFWSDHWTYNLDLVEGYLDIFPDRRQELLFGDATYAFYDSPAYVLPRSEKYVLSDGKVRQYGALLEDEEKLHKLKRKAGSTEWLRTERGRGEVYNTNLFVKIVSLALNKFATLDPYGMGVEMEGNKPGWNDAMNGLPGLFGSGMSETFELKRTVSFLLDVLDSPENAEGTARLPEEIAYLLEQVNTAVTSVLEGELTQFAYWDTVASAREAYRESIRFGITGSESDVALTYIRGAFSRFLLKLDEGIDRAVKLGNGLTPTYFRFEATRFEPVVDAEGEPVLSGYGLQKAVVQEFEAQALPYFLEGPTRWLKTLKNPAKAKEIYTLIKGTGLYDPQTSMYQTSVSLEEESHEIGRMRAFTPGWLERESNFLHMSYKYLLELLKAGLHEEFYSELKTSLVPFLDPAVYGRSTLENSSFIATGGNPDPGTHGRGFVARLSGSTAEFLSMWRKMMAGSKAFSVVDGELALSLSPVLPGWLFDEQGELTFTFLGQTKVTYYNHRKVNTFGDGGATIHSMTLQHTDGTVSRINGALLRGATAEALRRGEISLIKAELE